MAKTILKNKFGGLILSNFKIYYKAMRIQTMCYQHDRDRSMEKNREYKNNSYLWSFHF